MAAAQRLATMTSIDLAVARAHAASRTAAQVPTQRTITIGEPGSRGLRTYVQLFAAIAAANDVRCDVASNSTFVYAYGFSEDIDASHALYASLVVQMVRSCDAYLATGAHRPTPTITARLNFQLAFGTRIGSRLSDARDEAKREATASRTAAPGTAIALRNKEVELRDHYRSESQARGTWRATSASAGYSSAARRAGDRAGRQARLGSSPELPGARTRLPRGASGTTNGLGSMRPSSSSAPSSTALPNTVRAPLTSSAIRSRCRRRHGSHRSNRCSAMSIRYWRCPPSQRTGRRVHRSLSGPGVLRRPLITKTMTAQPLSPFPSAAQPAGRCENWWCCTRWLII